MIEGAVVIGTVVVAIVLVAVLALQGSVGRLSEEEGRPFLQRDVVEPPAGPGVEALHAEESGQAVPAAGSRR